MRAAWYDQQGPAAQVLRYGELPDPVPGPGEVRVRVRFSGVNPGDTKKRRGWAGSAMPYPRVIPHSDAAGVIDAVGQGVDPNRIGSRVWVYGAQQWPASAPSSQPMPPASTVPTCLSGQCFSPTSRSDCWAVTTSRQQRSGRPQRTSAPRRPPAHCPSRSAQQFRWSALPRHTNVSTPASANGLWSASVPGLLRDASSGAGRQTGRPQRSIPANALVATALPSPPAHARLDRPPCDAVGIRSETRSSDPLPVSGQRRGRSKFLVSQRLADQSDCCECLRLKGMGNSGTDRSNRRRGRRNSFGNRCIDRAGARQERPREQPPDTGPTGPSSDPASVPVMVRIGPPATTAPADEQTVNGRPPLVPGKWQQTQRLAERSPSRRGPADHYS